MTDLREFSRHAIFLLRIMAFNTLKKLSKQQIRTLKRQKILDRYYLLYQRPVEIKRVTNIFIPTVRRVIKSGEPHPVLKSHIGRSLKLNVRDIRRLVRAITTSADNR